MIKTFLLVLLLPLISFAQNDPITDSIENEIAELAKPVYLETYKIVNTAKFKINNAVAGRYPAKEAMSYYNDNLSQYMGSYKTIQGIKKRLDTAGDDFIKAMFLREKGRIAKILADQAHEEILELQAEKNFEKQKVKDVGLITLPPDIDSSLGVVVTSSAGYDPMIFTKVEQEAQYPGNWRSFLERNLDGQVAVDNGAAPGNYTVMVQFVVDVAGNVSDVKALTGHGYGMEQEAIRVIKKSNKWKPAIQNGREAKAFRKLPITFTVH